jgi:hypothetical protein
MATPLTACETLDREFFQLRAELLSLAASFDRMDRGEGSVTDDARWQQLLQAVSILLQPGPDRAARLQLLFSLPYDEKWRTNYQLTPRQD